MGGLPTLTTSIDISSMPKGINACSWRRAGSRSPFLATATIRFAMISRTVQAVPKLRSDLQAFRLVESLAHCRGCGVVERNVLDRNTTHRDLPKTYERERGSLSQSPRPEAVSVMAELWSFDWDLSGQNRPPVDGTITCRIYRFDVHSN